MCCDCVVQVLIKYNMSSSVAPASYIYSNTDRIDTVFSFTPLRTSKFIDFASGYDITPYLPTL